MGPLMSALVVDLDNARIEEILAAVVSNFGSEFEVAFKFNAIQAITSKNERENSPNVMNSVEEAEYSLQQADVSKAPLKKGILTKRGEQVKNWKRRHFQALNAIDNYEVAYYSDEECQRELGRITCCGYRVEMLSALDFTTVQGSIHGSFIDCVAPGEMFGFKLVPGDEKKRCWWFLADNEGSLNEWFSVFENACRKSKPAFDDNPFVRAGFLSAFRKTRSIYGFFGTLSHFGTESDMLESLFRDVLDREMFNDIFVTLQSSRRLNNGTKVRQVKMLNDLLDEKVKPLAISSWQKYRTAAISSLPAFEREVNRRLPLVYLAVDKIHERIYPSINDIVSPALLEVQFSLLCPFINATVPSIMLAYEHAIKGLYVDISKVLGLIIRNPRSLVSELSSIDQHIELMGVKISDPDLPVVSPTGLAAAKQILWDMFTVNLREMSDNMVGITPYEVYARVLDDIRQVLHNLVYSFRLQLQSEGVTNGIIAIFRDNLYKLANDALALQRVSMLNMLMDVAESHIQDRMNFPCNDYIATESEKFKKESSDIASLISLEYSGDRIIKDIVSNSLRILVNNAYEPASPRLTSLVCQLTMDAVNIAVSVPVS